MMMMIFMNLGLFMFFNVNFVFCVLFMMVLVFIMNINAGIMVVGNGLIIDNLSMMLIGLSTWISWLMLMSSVLIQYKENYKSFFMLVLLILLMLIYTFSVVDLLSFYISFEILLLPVFLLINKWGYQMERYQASYYLLFYTLIGSMPLLIGLLYIMNNYHSLIYLLKLDISYHNTIWLSLNMAFIIKLPIYGFHLWLPKAHVEAPVAGSMILAGLLLKLGGYGLYRVGAWLDLNFYFSFYLMSLAMWGGLISSYLCLYQTDIKAFVAYASIGHMGLFLIGFMCNKTISYFGGVIMLIGHGLNSSGLFCLMNILYERFNTRSIFLLSGLSVILPGFSLCLFFLLSSNMSAPFSLNLLSEIFIMLGVYSWCFMSSLCMILMFLVTGMYSVYMFSSLFQMNNFNSIAGYSMMNMRELLLVFMHWFPLNSMFLVIYLFGF